jgi:hypothetical protein
MRLFSHCPFVIAHQAGFFSGLLATVFIADVVTS